MNSRREGETSRFCDVSLLPVRRSLSREPVNGIVDASDLSLSERAL